MDHALPDPQTHRPLDEARWRCREAVKQFLARQRRRLRERLRFWWQGRQNSASAEVVTKWLNEAVILQRQESGRRCTHSLRGGAHRRARRAGAAPTTCPGLRPGPNGAILTLKIVALFPLGPTRHVVQADEKMSWIAISKEKNGFVLEGKKDRSGWVHWRRVGTH
jgi:hypothetical protein